MSEHAGATARTDEPPPRSWRERAQAWLHRHESHLIVVGARRALELNLPTQSLALAAQQILCTAPLLVAFAAAQRHGGEHNIGNVLSNYLALSPAATREFDALFNESASVSTHDTLIGLIAALLFATAIAATQQRWYEQVWSCRRGGLLRSTLRQLLWVAGLCGYLVIVLYAGRVGHGVGRRVHAGHPAGPVVQLGVSFVFFWWTQHLLLGGRVTWRRLAPAAIFMAMGMTVMVGLAGLVMSGEIVSEVADYGLIGSTFVLSLWLVVLSGVLFSGTLLGELITRRRAGEGGHEGQEAPTS